MARSPAGSTLAPRGEAAAPPLPPRRRVESIDLVRGLVMVIMALDHTRDFFPASNFDPTNLSRASAALFLTRLVTHLCAPTFVFLAGTSAYLSGAARGSRAELSRHLFIRGLWLIFLELTLVRFGWRFSLDWHFMSVQVIWALGWSMIVLAGLVWLPLPAIAAIGGGMVLLHNLTDVWDRGGAPLLMPLWAMLHAGGDWEINRSFDINFFYPLIPWPGVMALGYIFGAVVASKPDARRRRCLALGVGALALFVLLRSTNFYGDTRHLWAAPAHRPALYTFLAFFNTTKYPPSLQYLLMTLGTIMLVLAAVEGWHPEQRLMLGARRALLVFGRVPLFYYLLHIPLIHTLAVLDYLRRFGTKIPKRSWEEGPAVLYSLPTVYGIWVGVIVIMYLLCVRYDAYKRAHPKGWTRWI